MHRRVWALLLCGIASLGLAWAQEVSAGLTGRVTDPSGAAILGATVTARDQDRGTAWTAATNEDGIYSFPRIPTGAYGLRIEASGFKSYHHPNIALEVNQRGRVDVTLQLGAVSESIEVTSDAALLQTETTQVGVVVGAQTLDDAPLLSRNVIELTLLIPGVTTTDPSTFNTGTRGDASGGRPFVNGNREQSNNFMLDGIDSNQISDNLAPYQPSPDALQEMKVITNNASAEFGNFQGGVINMVIKSGTNQLHGNLFEHFRNDKLNANAWSRNWSGVNRTPIRWNQFGSTLGGRIVRDKLFFFVDYQGLRQAVPTSVVTATVFNVAWRNGDFSNLLTPTYKNTQLYNPFSTDATGKRAPFPRDQIPLSMYDPVALKLFADTRVFPRQTVNSQTENLRYTTHSKVSADQGDVKLDWKPAQRDYFTGRYSRGAQDAAGFNSFLLAFPAFRNVPLQHGVINWTRTVSPRVVNEARFGLNHNNISSGFSDNGIGDYAQQLGMKNAGSGLLQLKGFAWSTTLGGISDGVDRLFTSNVYHLADNVTLMFGRHMIKTGGQIMRQQVNTFFAGNNGRTGYMNFSGRFTAANAVNPTGTLVGEADFVLGLPTDLGRGVSTGTWGHRSTVFGLYVQDDWRIANNLTLNLGVRWEYHSPWVEVCDRQSNFGMFSGKLMLAGKDGNSRALYQPFLKDFQPRVGFAYTPRFLGKRTVVRGAYTISSYLEGTGTNLRLPLNPPFNSEYQALYNTPDFWLPPTRLVDGLAGINPKDPFQGATIRLWDPFVRPANSQQWNFTTEFQLPKSNVLTVAYVGQHGTHLMVPQPYSQKQLVNSVVLPSAYLAGNPALLKQITQISGTASDGNQKYHALQAHVRKRFSMGMEYQLGYTWSHGMTDAQGYYGAGAQSAGTGNYTQNLYDRKSEWGPSFFDNKFNMTGSFSYALPFGRRKPIGNHWARPIDMVLGGWQMSGIYTWHTGFPLSIKISGDPSATGSRGMRANVNGTPNDLHKIGPNQPFLDVKAYSVPAARTFGTGGVGIERGAGMRRLDGSLNKQFRVTERKSIQLRLSAFNVTNTPIFQAPASLVITAPTFGQIRAAQSERHVQVIAKFYF
jgi:hypothetical protein